MKKYVGEEQSRSRRGGGSKEAIGLVDDGQKKNERNKYSQI